MHSNADFVNDEISELLSDGSVQAADQLSLAALVHPAHFDRGFIAIPELLPFLNPVVIYNDAG
jgi:hypothetical protein